MEGDATEFAALDLANATALMQQAVSDDVFAGGVLLVSVGGKVAYHAGFGQANRFSGRPVTRDTVFDLASLTKPLATVPAVMTLIREGKLGLDDRLGDLLPECRSTDKAGIRLGQLLNHTSGLPDYRPYYEQLRGLPPAERKTRLHRLLVSEPLTADIGSETTYSDLGYMVLCWVVEVCSGQRLPEFLRARIYAPLGVDRQPERMLYFPGGSGDRRPAAAATEQCPWRQMLLEGLVHDDNAFVVGGYDGHAGLFGNAAGVHALLNCFRATYAGEENVPDLFDRSLLLRFVDRPAGSPRSLGFDAPSAAHSASGTRFSRNTVGHLGFTGTSFWMDLDRSIIIILLTNRVHPSRTNEKIKSFRPAIHDAVMITLQDAALPDRDDIRNASP